MSKRVLVIDDEPGHRLMVRAVLEDLDWEVVEAGDGREGLESLSQQDPDVVLLDIRMPGMDGFAVLERALSMRPGLPVVMLTAYGSVGSAVEAMKRGAFDYLTKPADNEELAAVLDKALDYARLSAEGEDLRRVADGAGAVLVGESEEMHRVKELISQVGPSEATVLVTGESGTGKELVAEGLHAASARAKGPLVKVNCAALPADLLESELFGYVKGAFTGAVKDKPGRFQLASGGTLFLDEVAELEQPLQAKLLRALQERVVEPLGSVTPQETDVRILAATNRDLAEQVRESRFREDLFFRLNVVEIHVPPLRERPGDIPLLAGHLLEKLGEKNRKQVRRIAPGFAEALTAYDWPGNVRELENVLERALILSRSDVLTPDLLPPGMAASIGNGRGTDGSDPSSSAADAPASLDQAEKRAIEQALAANDGHREKTAEALGISRRTLQYKLKKYGLTRR